MHTVRFLLSFSCLFISVHLLPAQTPTKAERAVYRLQEAGFLSSYKDYRAEAEMHVALFKAKEDSYSTEELVVMKNTYRRTATAFEDFIHSIRNDLLDRRTRKVIRKRTEQYVKEKLESLNQVYVDYYQGRLYATYAAICLKDETQSLALHRNEGIPPAVPAALIAPVAKATMEVLDFLDKQNSRDLEALKKVLEKEWVEPNRFRPWEEI